MALVQPLADLGLLCRVQAVVEIGQRVDRARAAGADGTGLVVDQSLRTHDARFGIRQLADVQEQATLAGLQLQARHTLPANNLLLVWGHPPGRLG